jgi:hypothetical protein
MPIKPFLGVLLAATAIAPTLAQTAAAPPPGPDGSAQQEARGYANPPMPNQEAINAGGRAGTASLNNQVASANASVKATNDANAAMSAEQQAQYEIDREAYMDALMHHDAAVNRTDVRYARQQRAYADAMFAWRRQVYACKHGHQRACDLPPPDPSRFY